MTTLAQIIPGPSGPIEITPPPGIPGSELSLEQLLSFGVNALFALGVILALFFLMWGGISWITSGGDKDKLEKSRKTIVYAIVGLVVIVLSFTIIYLLGVVLGVDFLKGITGSSGGSGSNGGKM